MDIRVSFERKWELDPDYNQNPQIEPDVRIATHDFNLTDWTYNEADQCYHYNIKLQPGETTEALCTQVHFSGALMGNQYQNSDYLITVTPYSDGEGTAAGNQMIEIPNKSGKELPATGGIGTTAYTLTGLMLICASVTGIYIMRKNRERERSIK